MLRITDWGMPEKRGTATHIVNSLQALAELISRNGRLSTSRPGWEGCKHMAQDRGGSIQGLQITRKNFGVAYGSNSVVGIGTLRSK